MQTDVNSKRGKLLRQYVCARVTTLKGIDVGLFDFDRHNSLYFFIMNADEEIYMRYGGRDSESASTYLNLRSLELALAKGLELHASRDWQPIDKRPPKLLPKDIPLLGKRMKRRYMCVECHLIGDFQTIALEQQGKLDRIRDLYVSPDIKTIGLFLDVPKGLVLKEAKGPAKSAGIEPGDQITHFNGLPIYTFADFQFRFGRVDRAATEIRVGIERGGKRLDTLIKLPKNWWFSDLAYRHWTVEPLLSFQTEPLSSEEKRKRKLPTASIASRVTSMESVGEAAEPPLQDGDIILDVNGVQVDEVADDAELHIKLRYSSGDRLRLRVERNGKEFESQIETVRRSFRKDPVDGKGWVKKSSTSKGEVAFEAEIVGEFLVVQAKHAQGWHTYAMDNEIRAKEAAGGKVLLGVEQGLAIKVSGGIERISSWRQAKPKEFSDLGQKWYSFGFDDDVVFACRIKSTSAKDAIIGITGQTCDSESCRQIDIQLRMPNVKSQGSVKFEQLVPVRSD